MAFTEEKGGRRRGEKGGKRGRKVDLYANGTKSAEITGRELKDRGRRGNRRRVGNEEGKQKMVQP